MASRNRILFLVTGLKVGGAEVLVRDLALDLRDEFDVMVATLAFPGEIYDQLEAAGIPVTHLGMDSVLHVPTALYRFFALLRSFRPHLIHTHMIHADLVGRWGKLLGIPIVTTVHVKLLERPYLLWIDRLTSFFVDRYVAVSPEIGRWTMETRAVDAGKVIVITNGIHLDAFRSISVDRSAKRQELGLPVNVFVVGCIANFRIQKGHTFLLQAWPAVITNHPQSRLILVGWGPTENALQDEAERLGISDSVLFVGSREDVPQLLKTFDLFVLPSLYEGLPLTLVEALAAGCPVIATDIPENRYVLEQAGAGKLVPPKDPSALAAAIAEAIQNPAAIPNRPNLGLFDWSRFVAQHRQLYGRFV